MLVGSIQERHQAAPSIFQIRKVRLSGSSTASHCLTFLPDTYFILTCVILKKSGFYPYFRTSSLGSILVRRTTIMAYFLKHVSSLVPSATPECFECLWPVRIFIQFPKLVDDHPDVVRGRLRLDLDYAPSKHDLLSMTTSVRACYAKRPDLISLGRRSDLVFQLFVRGSPVHGYIRRCGYSRVGLRLEIRPDRNQLGIDSEEDSEDEDGTVRPELRPWHTDVLWINNETRSDADAAHDGLQRLVVQ